MKRLVGVIFLLVSLFSFASDVKAPDFQLEDQFSQTHTLKKYEGKRVMLVFWASWCGYCQEELETLNKLYEEIGENSKEVVFLTFNDEEQEELKKFLDEKKYKFPVINDKTIFYQYYVENYPTTYFLDSEGKVLQSVIGKVKEEEIQKFINIEKK